MENCLVESARQWRIAASVVVVLSWLPAACGGDDDGIQVLTDDQIGSVVEVDADEQFEIRLESNLGAGYAWQVSAMTTTDLVALTSRTYVASDTDLVGAAGTDVFVFTAEQG